MLYNLHCVQPPGAEIPVTVKLAEKFAMVSASIGMNKPEPVMLTLTWLMLIARSPSIWSASWPFASIATFGSTGKNIFTPFQSEA
jgi:hypothetical protein